MSKIPNSVVRKRKRLRMLRRHPFCVYCGWGLTEEDATLDHIQPRSKGGTDALENLVLSCRLCNKRKGHMSFQQFMDLTPEERKALPIRGSI